MVGLDALLFRTSIHSFRQKCAFFLDVSQFSLGSGYICFAGEMSKSMPPPAQKVSTHAPLITMFKV